MFSIHIRLDVVQYLLSTSFIILNSEPYLCVTRRKSMIDRKGYLPRGNRWNTHYTCPLVGLGVYCSDLSLFYTRKLLRHENMIDVRDWHDLSAFRRAETIQLQFMRPFTLPFVR